MEISNLVFTDTLPSIDLHGYDRQSAIVAINDFIEESLVMQNEFVSIIHGIGSGVIREATINALLKNKNVLDFKSDYNNRGCMIVKINIKS